MEVKAIVGIQYTSDTALGMIRVRFAICLFCDEDDRSGSGSLNREAEPGDSTSNDQEVAKKCFVLPFHFVRISSRSLNADEP